MINFKLLLYACMVLLSGFKFLDSRSLPAKWVIIKGCSLKVEGSTNVNKFSCAVTNYSKPDTLIFYKNNSGGQIKFSGSLKIDIKDFDCHNSMMTKDLRKTLKAATFPEMSIRFISLDKYPGINDLPGATKGVVVIGLAGVTRRFEVNYRFIANDPGSLTLIGTQNINFSDFNIVPPRKIGGMIQTNNELKVEFNLKMKALD